MKAWSEFFPDVLPDVIECPEPIAELAIKRAAQEFFDRTRVWRIWTDDIATVISVTDYDLNLQPKSELVRIERATRGGDDVEITTAGSLPSDWVTNNSGFANCIHTVDRKTVTLLPKPLSAQVLKIEVSLKPSNSALGIENFLFDQYVEKIAMGAKARILKQPKKPYSDLNQGMILEAQFNQAIASTGINVMRGFSSNRSRSRGRFF